MKLLGRNVSSIKFAGRNVRLVKYEGRIIRDFGSAEPPGFQPSDLPNLALWLDGDLSSVTYHAGGNGVSQATDLSGNGNHLVQPTAAAAPIHGIRTVNGVKAFDFDGSSHWARVNAEIGGGGVLHAFLVAVIDTAQSGRYLLEAGAVAGGRDGWNLRQTTSNQLQLLIEDTADTTRDILQSGSNSISTGTPFLVEVLLNGSDYASLTLNGTLRDDDDTLSGGGFANPENELDFFCSDGGSNLTDGAFTACVIYEDIVTGDDLIALRNYLTTRGLTSP